MSQPRHRVPELELLDQSRPVHPPGGGQRLRRYLPGVDRIDGRHDEDRCGGACPSGSGGVPTAAAGYAAVTVTTLFESRIVEQYGPFLLGLSCTVLALATSTV